MTMTKIDPECSRYPQQGRNRTLIPLSYHFAVLKAIAEQRNLEFGSFAALPLETLVAKYYIKMPLVNVGTPQLQFDTF